MAKVGHSPKKQVRSDLQASLSLSDPNVSMARDEEPNFNVTLRAKRSRLEMDNESMTSELEAFKVHISGMFEKFLTTTQNKFEAFEDRISTIQRQNEEICFSNRDIEKALNSLGADLKSMDDKICNLEKDKKDLKLYICNLENKIDFLEISSLKTCVEVRNIPKVEKENKSDLFNYVYNLGKNLKLDFDLTDSLKDVHRLPSKREKTQSSISIDLKSTLIKSQFLNAVKKFNQSHSESLNSTHLGIKLPKQPVYASELLTPKVKRLLFLAKDFARSANYTYVWASNGRVLIRKAEGQPYIIIKNETDIIDLRNKLVK